MYSVSISVSIGVLKEEGWTNVKECVERHFVDQFVMTCEPIWHWCTCGMNLE